MKKAGKGKRKNNERHKKLRKYKENPEQYVDYMRNYIVTYHPITHFFKEINDGISAKKRLIVVPSAEEVVLHNAIMIVLGPILKRGMYEHSYACIEGRGIHQGKKVVEKWIRKDFKNTKYCCKMDIKQFFNSVNQLLLLEKFRKLIRDERFLNLIEIVLKSVSYGLALGFTTSHWFANWLLTPLDHYIKEVLKVKHYIRFVDDVIIFGSNKRKLHKARWLIFEYLKNNLFLETKPNWQVFLLSDVKSNTIIYPKTKEGRPLDFLGFKFYRSRTTLRSSIFLRIQRKAKRIFNKKGKATIKDARQMVTYGGFCKYADCFEWFKYKILKYVSISKLRKKVSAYDKANNLSADINNNTVLNTTNIDSLTTIMQKNDVNILNNINQHKVGKNHLFMLFDI